MTWPDVPTGDERPAIVPRRPSEVPINRGRHHADLDGAPLSEIRFRLTRYSANELKNLDLYFVFFDRDGRMTRVEVLDFSETGLGIATPRNPPLQAGDVLRDVEVHAGDRRIFRGHGTVVQQPSRPDRLGIALTGLPLSIDELIEEDERAGAVAAFSAHFSSLTEQLDPAIVPERYRAAIADIETLLVGLQAHFGQHGSPGKEVRLSKDSLQQIENLVVPEFSRLIRSMDEAARPLTPRAARAAAAYAKRLLHPLLAEAPIPRRAYEKPREYAGDFALMHQIYRDRDNAPSTFGQLLNRLCCRLPVTKAGLTRISTLTDFILAEIQSRQGRRVRVGSIGCGSSEEIVRLFEAGVPGNTPLSISLIDQDREALSFSNRRLLRLESSGRAPPTAEVHYFHTAVKTLTATPEDLDDLLGRFDVLYTVGLFDYLTTSAARAMLCSLGRFLSPTGVLLVGNFADHPGRAFMEHVLDWELFYRTKDSLRTLAESAFDAVEFESDVMSDHNGTHLFLVSRRVA